MDDTSVGGRSLMGEPIADQLSRMKCDDSPVTPGQVEKAKEIAKEKGEKKNGKA